MVNQYNLQRSLTLLHSKASAECWSFALIQLWHLLLSKIFARNFLQGFFEPIFVVDKVVFQMGRGNREKLSKLL